MPRSWHDRHSANLIEDEETKDLYFKIIADKKPYFMRYIYPMLMKQYNTYIKNTNKNCLREFQMTVPELLEVPEDELSEQQREFLRFYRIKMPVSNNNCIMNKICRKFEDEFDGFLGKRKSDNEFDYTIMKSDATYAKSQYAAIKKLYEAYNKALKNFAVFSKYERIDEYESTSRLQDMKIEFLKKCTEVCVNEESLCNVVLDICYQRSSTKKFAWEMCGGQIIKNLLSKNNNTISFPERDNFGDIHYLGENFTVKQIEVSEDL